MVMEMVGMALWGDAIRGISILDPDFILLLLIVCLLVVH